MGQIFMVKCIMCHHKESGLLLEVESQSQTDICEAVFNPVSVSSSSMKGSPVLLESAQQVVEFWVQRYSDKNAEK